VSARKITGSASLFARLDSREHRQSIADSLGCSRSALYQYLASPRYAAERLAVEREEAAVVAAKERKDRIALARSKRRSKQKWSWQTLTTECPLPADWQQIGQEAQA
jgi:predicted transcriptional regulator